MGYRIRQMRILWTIGLLVVAAKAAPAPYDYPLAYSDAYFAAQHRGSVTQSFLSSTLGSNMVLQRGPQQATVWGFATPGVVITTTMDITTTLTTTVGADGIWRQQLPATAASSTAHTFGFNSSTGQTASMENVVFGDVYLCGGQSNMQFAMPAIENATTEIATADKYPLIRLFTVGQKTSSRAPLQDLQTIEQQWSVASSKTVAGGGGFGYFSAVCWIFGRQLHDELQVPIGLINNNWGGTPVESWTTPETLQACNVSTVDSTLYNAMIYPYVIGPMALTGFTWYQGEANVDERRGDEGAIRYSCTFPGMIRQWREAFQAPDAFFGFVQLSTWCGDPELIAEMRTIGQMAALALPKVGYSTNADHGAGCNIHPPPKQFCATRLANSALAIQYNKPVAWKSPSFASQKCGYPGPGAATIKLSDVSSEGLRDDVVPFNYLNGAFDCTKNAGKCAWAELKFGDGSWVNATVAVSGDTVTFTSDRLQFPVASRYGWGAVPMMNLYDKQTELPVLPWAENCTSV